MPDQRSRGASAGDFGLLAALVVVGWRYQEVLPKRSRPAFGIAVLVFTLHSLLRTFGSEGVDYWGHLGGLLGGGGLAALLQPQVLGRNRVVQGGVYGGMLAVILGIALLGPRLHLWVPASVDGFEATRPLLWEESWSALGQSAFASPTKAASLAITTDRFEQNTSLEAELKALRERLLSLDSEASIENKGLLNIGELEGEQLGFSFQISGEDQPFRTGWAWVGVRGHYVHSIVVESEDLNLGRLVFERALASAALSIPEKVEELEAGGIGWRAEKDKAEALRLLGKQPEALELLKSAQEKWPGERELRFAWLETLTDPPAPKHIPEVLAMLAAFPDDASLLAKAALCLNALGQAEAARQLLEQGLVRWPGNRSLERAQKKLVSLPEDLE
jgi:tetratricopeptide (TPR) repeat protein